MNYVPRLLKPSAAVLLLALLIAGLSTAPSTYAASPLTVGGKAIVTNTGGDPIRIRMGAGTENGLVATTSEGQVVNVLAGPAKDSKGNFWYRIEAYSGKGWVISDYLSGKTEAAAPKTGSAKATGASAPSVPQLTGFATVANTGGDPLRVRSMPSTKVSIITTLAPGASVAIKAGPLLDADKVTWYQISAKGITGWAMGRYLAQSKAPADTTEANSVSSAPKDMTEPAASKPADRPTAEPAVAVSAPQGQAPKAEPAATTNTATNNSTNNTSRSSTPQTQTQAAQAPVASTTRGSIIVANALKYIGYRYRFGGTSPSGFDCSGYIYYVMNQSGVRIGRDMMSQYNSGARIGRGALQPGDLVFFSNTYKPGLSHTGIYIGNGRFAHAENESTGVMVSSMSNPYYSSRYTGAVRPR